MLCELTTTASKRSGIFGVPASAPAPGTIVPCRGMAQRRCPSTGEAVCNGHSRTDTSREGIRVGARRCSACGKLHAERAWRAVA
jgi:hypothetical protein